MANFKVNLLDLEKYLGEIKYNEGNIDSYELTGSGNKKTECSMEEIQQAYTTGFTNGKAEKCQGKSSGHSKHSKSHHVSHSKTKGFEVRASDNDKFKGMQDLYLREFKNKGHDVSDKNLLDEIYGKIFDRAIKAKGADKLDSMYDGYNTVKRGIRLIRTMIASSHFCISDPVTFRPHKGQFGAWDVYIDTPWVDLTTHYGSTNYHINLDNFVKQRVVNSQMLRNFDKKNSHNILLVPVGVPGHSVCVIFEGNKGMKTQCYWADPNGPVDVEGEFETNCNYVKGLWKQACEKAGIKWMDHLLCNVKPQGGSALTYFHSGGFCGGFTVMLALLIGLNSDVKLEKIREYLQYRIKQWENHASSKDKRNQTQKSKDNILQVQKMFEWVEKNGKKWNLKLNPAYSVPAPASFDKDWPINLKTFNEFKKGIRVFKENKLTDEEKNSFIREISNALDTDSHTADLAHFRKGMLKAMGDHTPLNWMECHILLFLEFIYEWYEKFEPFTLIDIPQAEKQKIVPPKAGDIDTKSSNQIAGAKDKKSLKAFNEKYDYRSEYLKKCGKESYNQAAKEGLLYDVKQNTNIVDMY